MATSFYEKISLASAADVGTVAVITVSGLIGPLPPFRIAPRCYAAFTIPAVRYTVQHFQRSDGSDAGRSCRSLCIMRISILTRGDRDQIKPCREISISTLSRYRVLVGQTDPLIWSTHSATVASGRLKSRAACSSLGSAHRVLA